MAETPPETAPAAETAAEPVIQGSEQIQESGEDEAVPAAEAVPTEPDHKGLLHELAGIIRDIPVNALEVAHVTELKAWLTSHGL